MLHIPPTSQLVVFLINSSVKQLFLIQDNVGLPGYAEQIL